MNEEVFTPGAAGETETGTEAAEPSLQDMEAQIAQALAQARADWAAEEQARLEAAVAAERVHCDDLLWQNALEGQLREAGLDPAFAPFLKGGPPGGGRGPAGPVRRAGAGAGHRRPGGEAAGRGAAPGTGAAPGL